jgi:hypothetical protein
LEGDELYVCRAVTRLYIAASPAHALTREARAIENFTFVQIFNAQVPWQIAQCLRTKYHSDESVSIMRGSIAMHSSLGMALSTCVLHDCCAWPAASTNVVGGLIHTAS